MKNADPVRHPNERRFEEFFIRDSYVTLKNYLYNYLERKRAINRRLAREPRGRVLEVGSGLSPIVTDRKDVIYSELSFRALQRLRDVQRQGLYVVADGTRLPFATSSLDQIVCSEVLEHVERDGEAIAELARVVRPSGAVLITVPHRKRYYAADDRYVGHFRRYDAPEMREKLTVNGLEVRGVTKVLGPLEKITMLAVVVTLSAFEKRIPKPNGSAASGSPVGAALRSVLRPTFKYAHRAYAVLARLDAAVMPQSLAAVLMFDCTKPGAAPR